LKDGGICKSFLLINDSDPEFDDHESVDLVLAVASGKRCRNRRLRNCSRRAAGRSRT
jgi:hypothetical protein